MHLVLAGVRQGQVVEVPQVVVWCLKKGPDVAEGAAREVRAQRGTAYGSKVAHRAEWGVPW